MFVDLLAARGVRRSSTSPRRCTHDMVVAGAPVFETRETWHEQTVPVDGLELFVEGRLVLIASGRPELAR